MSKRLAQLLIAAVGMLLLSFAAQGQSSAQQQKRVSKADSQASDSAPRRDLSGIWDVENTMEGISPAGVKSHAPFTAWGANMANNVYKPGDGPRRVPVGHVNDPLDSCDPAGFPRDLLFEFRPFQVVQTPNQVLMLYQYQRVWRVIWIDGRPLPKDPDPRWYGYSVGKWVDDQTFVVETTGLDERTWLDNAGDPHSSELRVEERYHRLSRGSMEVTVKIDDPKTYMASWLARDKLRLKLMASTTDLMEMICAPSEAEEYKKVIANPVTNNPPKK